jgi:hypothetical protein
MASDDDKQEEEEFEDILSEVEGDASKVGNTSAQEKFEKLKKAVKESSVGGTRKIRNTTLTQVKVLNTFNSTVRAPRD